MTAARLWARNELAQRWKALVVLGLIAGAAAGLCLGALVQARRSATVYDRWRTATHAPDAIVFGTQTGSLEALDYSGVLALPEVVDGGQFNLAPVGIKEAPTAGSLPTADPHLYRTTARPLLREGRLPEPDRDDELVVNELAAEKLGLRVGREVTLVSSNDLDAFFTTGKYEGGPSVRATVVGVGDSPIDFIFLSDEPGFYPSAAMLTEHPEIPRVGNLVVRLRPGTDVAAFHRRAAAAMNLPDVPVRDLAEERKRFVHATDLERTALLLFAAAVALAGLVLVGQALARTVYGMAEPGATLSALGLTRPELVTGMVLPSAVTAAVAAVTAMGIAYVISDRITVGLSRTLEPDLGLVADWMVLAGGAVMVVVLTLGGAALAALRATGARRAAGTPRGLGILAGVRSVVPLPVALGASLALESGRGERSTPVRPALAGAVAGILGIVGALGLVRGIDDALATPERSGQAWNALILPTEDVGLADMASILRKHPDVTTVAVMSRRPFDVNGEGLPVYALERLSGGEHSFVVLDGRAPAAANEVAVAPASLQAIDKRVGESITISGERYTVVGTALLPQTAHSSFDQGAWITPAGMKRLAEDDAFGDAVAVQAKHASGIDGLLAFEEALRERLPQDVEIELMGPPQDVLLLRNVRTLPRVLAAFLGLLGVAALGHALVTSVRRRRQDLAVLRAVGFRPAQNAATIIWQATTVAVVGLVIGLPLGIAAGRVSWRWVADSTPLLYVAPIAGLAIALSVPGALAVANALAALPARRAARLRAVDILRTE